MKAIVKNEYDPLRYVLMAYPQNFDILEIINELQRKHIGQINRDVANRQYNAFVNALITLGIRVQFLDIIESPEQVFTRDIGFQIHDVLFVSNMAKKIRKQEPKTLVSYIENDLEVNVHKMKNNAEGGDVFVHDNKVFVGISRRTSLAGMEEIKSVLDAYNLNIDVIPIRFEEDQLHLDCVFNILNQDTCIYTDYVIDQDVIKKHFKHAIFLPREDVEYLGTNFLHVGHKKYW